MRALKVVRPDSIEEAVALLAIQDGVTKVVGGGTWMMRSDDPADVLLDVARLEGLSSVVVEHDRVRIGAAVSHAELGIALRGDAGLDGLRRAASKSANPHVRHRATLGGNIAATDFAPADLVPMLMALEAEVELAGVAGRSREHLTTWRPRADEVVLGVVCPRWFTLSAHARLTMRAAGDYPVAIVSIAADLDERGVARTIRVAVGALGRRAFRWSSLEDELLGHRLTAASALGWADRLVESLPSLDGVGVPAWYRRAVVPGLVDEAVQSMLGEAAR